MAAQDEGARMPARTTRRPARRRAVVRRLTATDHMYLTTAFGRVRMTDVEDR